MSNSLRCKIKHLCYNGALTERERDRILKALEQAQWIPVSERLPEEFVSVLVCYKSQGGMAQCVTERIVDFLDGGTRWSGMYGQVPIAWMPLPESYKVKSEEDNAKSEVEVCSSNFIQLKQDVLNNKQLWRKLREIEDEDSD